MLIGGIGRIAGRECMIVANDATIKGGTYYPMTVKKHLRAQEIARRTGCPASIWSIPAAPTCRTRTRCFPTASISAASSTIRRRCRRRGIAQIAVVMGSCTAGGAYVPAMSDESIIVRNQGTIFLGGPPLVKAATGEVVTRRGTRRRRCARRQSGVTDHYAQNDATRWDRAAHRRQSEHGEARRLAHARTARRRCLIPPRKSTAWSRRRRASPIDVREVIARIVDGSEFDEFKRCTARPWSPASPISGAIRSASSPITASCSAKAR
jgi:3-methylcrotonyl-CoA carboxylase beta subunit